MKWLINKIVGSKNQRELKKLGVIVNKINELEYQALSEEALKKKHLNGKKLKALNPN